MLTYVDHPYVYARARARARACVCVCVCVCYYTIKIGNSSDNKACGDRF